MDIKKFVAQRKALRLSQVKLSAGICTQATLSKFERQGRVPSLAILEQLCARLGLTVDDLNEVQATSVTKMRERLDKVEEQLMMEDYRTVLQSLDEIDETEIDAIPLKMQFYYLRGMLNALINKKPDDILFDFSRILNGFDEKHETIFTQLAYVGSGVLYERRKQPAKAKFYFTKTYRYVQRALVDAHEEDGNDYLRLLTLVFYTAEFYALAGDFVTSNDLINAGVLLCSDKHVTYYLPRLKFLAAENAIKQHQDDDAIQRLMNEALAFARINHNEVVEIKVGALRSRYEQAASESE
ncbi:helix-turn-helix domain-containing protein [Levilactobacillus fujinensis]|uniref:Helix-turn-helix domain-containing protein n=1 Tax=Levilactobacillus fujinensis TaxID=2486024 RepID=A0ABW1TE99_9LACO|nr:helix-turn-helix transcriptional regulator [Levilactobacillus fujinensis]